MNAASKKRRNSNIHNNEKDDMNLKKRKSDTDINDNGCLLNEIGIKRFNAGQYNEAKRSFVEALRIEKKNVESNICQHPKFENILSNKTPSSVFLESLSTSNGPSPEKAKPNIYPIQDYDEGMNIYTSTLQTHESLPIELRYATLLYNIGLICVCNRDYEEAIQWFKSSLKPISQLKQRPNNDVFLNIAKIHHNLGHCHYRLGNTEASMKHYKGALAQARKLGLDKRELAAAYNCVGVIHFHTPSQITNALEFFQKGLSADEHTSGEPPREIGTLLNNIGRVHYAQSEYEKALKAFTKALEIRCQSFGRSSIDVEATMLNTAQTYQQIGELDEAMRLYQNFIDLNCSRLGPNDRDTVIAYKAMGRIYLERNDIKNAHSMFVQALKAERAAFGESHAQLSSTINEIGSLCYKMNDIQAALNYFNEGLSIQKSSVQMNKQNVVTTLKNIAHIQRENNNCSEAIEAYNEAKMLQIQVHGKFSLEVASINVSLGLMQYELTDYSSSLAFYNEALQVRREILGTDYHRDIASLLNFIGLAMYRMGEYENSKEVFFRSMRIWQKLGLINRDVANLWSNMATVSLELDEEERAIIYYWESLRIEEMLPGDDPGSHLTLEHLGRVYQQCGELDHAISCFITALDMVQNTASQKPPAAAIKLLIIIGTLYLMKGDKDKMMKYYVEGTRLSIECQEVDQDFQSMVFAGHNYCVLSKLACAAAA